MSEKLKENEVKHLTFRGKPLVRNGNTICYGSMKDKYILFMMILSEKEADTLKNCDKKIPDAIIVQILSTDLSKPAHERVVKQFNKNGLYDAMEIGLIWLDQLNGGDDSAKDGKKKKSAGGRAV